MKTLLWLDDIRDPVSNPEWLVFSPIDAPFQVVWVKTFAQFVGYISFNGLPDGIAFDHDLADNYELREELPMSQWYNLEEKKEYTGYDCAKWLVDFCIDNNLELPAFSCHSANPAGKRNILELLNNFKKHQEL